MTFRDKVVASQATSKVMLSFGEVEIRTLSAGDIFEIRDQAKGDAEASILLIAKSIVPEEGETITREDVMTMSVADMNILMPAIFDLNNLSEDATKIAQEQLKKIQSKGHSTKSH